MTEIIIISVLVAIVVMVLGIVIAGFWIYLCCGRHRDLVWRRYEPDPTYPERPLRVVIGSGGEAIVESHMGSEVNFNGDEVSLQPSIIAPITRKPTVRKNKLFASQPNLGYHQNLSQSLGRMMESEPASHYQLSLDENDELLVDQGLFELEHLQEYDTEPSPFGLAVQNDESIELSPVKFEPNNQNSQPLEIHSSDNQNILPLEIHSSDNQNNLPLEIHSSDNQNTLPLEIHSSDNQNTQPLEIHSSSTPDVRENTNDQLKEVIDLQPFYSSSPAILDDSRDPPTDGVQMMQSESRDGDLEDSEASDMHDIIDDDEKPKVDSEAKAAASSSRDNNSQASSTVEVTNNDDTTVDAQNDQLKANDEAETQTNSSVSENSKVAMEGESKEDSEANDSTSNKEDTVDDKEVVANENSEPEIQSQDERSINEKTSGEELNERTSSVNEIKAVNGSNSKLKSDEEGVTMSELKNDEESGNDKDKKEVDSTSDQEERKDSLEEYDGDESTNTSSSGLRIQEHSEQKQNSQSPNLSGSANTSVGSLGDKNSEKESDNESLVETTSPPNVSDLKDMFQKIVDSPTSSPTIETKKYNPLNYPKQNILQSGLDTSESESSLDDPPSSDNIQHEVSEQQHDEMLTAHIPKLSGNEQKQQGISPLATVIHKAPLPSNLANISDENESESSEVNLATGEILKIEPKLAVHVKTSESETAAQKPVRKRKVTPAITDMSTFQHQLRQSIAAVSALDDSDSSNNTRPKPMGKGNPFLGSITEEGGFREEDEELDSEDETLF